MFEINQIKRSLDYLEAHLEEHLTLQELSDVAHYSRFHYQRLFQMLTGHTVGNYIRLRRMSCASKALLRGDERIIVLAMKYQYDSPEAFTRAFKKVYGISPSSVRKKGIVMKEFPRLSIQVQLTADTPLSYRLIDSGALYIKGYQKTFTAEEIVQGKAYPAFWKQIKNELSQLAREQACKEYVGAGSYRSDNPDLYDAIVGCFTEKIEGAIYIAPCKWCVFQGKGPVSKTLPALWSRIFLEWFPETSFQHSGAMEIECFPIGDQESTDYEYQIWIPLRGAVHEDA